MTSRKGGFPRDLIDAVTSDELRLGRMSGEWPALPSQTQRVKTVPTPRLRRLPTTTPPAGVFVTHHPTAHQLKMTMVSLPLIPGRHVPTTSKVKY